MRLELRLQDTNGIEVLDVLRQRFQLCRFTGTLSTANRNRSTALDKSRFHLHHRLVIRDTAIQGLIGGCLLRKFTHPQSRALTERLNGCCTTGTVLTVAQLKAFLLRELTLHLVADRLLCDLLQLLHAAERNEHEVDGTALIPDPAGAVSRHIILRCRNRHRVRDTGYACADIADVLVQNLVDTGVAVGLFVDQLQKDFQLGVESHVKVFCFPHVANIRFVDVEAFLFSPLTQVIEVIFINDISQRIRSILLFIVEQDSQEENIGVNGPHIRPVDELINV